MMGYYDDDPIALLVGKTFAFVTGAVGDDEMVFKGDEGAFRFFHRQDCCESVEINEVVGDLSDLVGSPILLAEEVNSDDHPKPSGEYVDSYTWTFYRFQTIKGSVTVRWLGKSNGYYSESVSFKAVPEVSR